MRPDYYINAPLYNYLIHQIEDSFVYCAGNISVSLEEEIGTILEQHKDKLNPDDLRQVLIATIHVCALNQVAALELKLPALFQENVHNAINQKMVIASLRDIKSHEDLPF